MKIEKTLILCLLSLIPACKIAEKEDNDELKNLTTLPYASVVMVDDTYKSGVETYQKDKVYDGYNLFCLRTDHFACLSDLNGKCLKKWENNDGEPWQYTELDKEGNLYFIEKPRDDTAQTQKLHAFGKMTKDNKLVWYKKGRYHHDFDLLENDVLVVFNRKERVVSWNDQEIPILDDKIVFFNSKTGEELKQFSLYDLLGNEFITKRQVAKIKQRENLADLIQAIKTGGEKVLIEHDTPGDVFHSNAIMQINRDIEGVAKKGDFLVSVRAPSLVAVIKSDFSGLRWQARGVFKKQHQPILLDNNHILVFDNRYQNGFSRAVEYDMQHRQVVWQYSAKNKGEFYSGSRGGVQKLPNGNVFITSSNQGQLFEVTSQGEIVWRYVTQGEERAGHKLRTAIYRARRYSKDFIENIFSELKK